MENDDIMRIVKCLQSVLVCNSCHIFCRKEGCFGASRKEFQLVAQLDRTPAKVMNSRSRSESSDLQILTARITHKLQPSPDQYHDIKSIILPLNRPPIKFLIAASCHFPTWIQGIPHPWDVVVQRCNNTVARCIVVLRCISRDYSLASTGRLRRTSSPVPPSQVGSREACHRSKSLAAASAHNSPHRNNYCATLDRGSSCSCFQPWQHLFQLMPSASCCNPADARTRCRAAQMSCESELRSVSTIITDTKSVP